MCHGKFCNPTPSSCKGPAQSKIINQGWSNNSLRPLVRARCRVTVKANRGAPAYLHKPVEIPGKEERFVLNSWTHSPTTVATLLRNPDKTRPPHEFLAGNRMGETIVIHDQNQMPRHPPGQAKTAKTYALHENLVRKLFDEILRFQLENSFKLPSSNRPSLCRILRNHCHSTSDSVRTIRPRFRETLGTSNWLDRFEASG